MFCVTLTLHVGEARRFSPFTCAGPVLVWACALNRHRHGWYTLPLACSSRRDAGPVCNTGETRQEESDNSQEKAVLNQVLFQSQPRYKCDITEPRRLCWFADLS
jgi:hypothetical protein